MLSLHLSKAQGFNDFFENHLILVIWYSLDIALGEYSHMSIYVLGFVIFSGILNHFVLPKLASTSIKALRKDFN